MQMRRAHRKPIIHCTESSFRQPGAVHRGEEVPRRSASAYALCTRFCGALSLSHERAMAIAARRRDSNTRCGARVHEEPERLSSARGTMRRGAQTNAAMDWSTIFSSSQFLLPSLLLCPHKIFPCAVRTGVAYSDSETEIFLARAEGVTDVVKILREILAVASAS